MDKQIICVAISLLVVVVRSVELPSTTRGEWYDVLHQLTLTNKRLEADATKCAAKLAGLNDVLSGYKNLTAVQLTNIQVGQNICRKDLIKATSDLATYKLLYNQLLGSRVKPSCAAWKDAGSTVSGFYMIDPDVHGSVTPFTVECVMDDVSGKVVTVFHHDSEARTDVGKCDTALTCVHIVRYQATMAQIMEVIKASTECKQFIQYDCHHSFIWHTSGQRQAWYSRDGARMNYWGGATPGSAKCACGMTNTCVKPGSKCNCDMNDKVWRSDSGDLSDKATLPVSKMAFGDTDSPDEHGFYRLGPLKCYN